MEKESSIIVSRSGTSSYVLTGSSMSRFGFPLLNGLISPGPPHTDTVLSVGDDIPEESASETSGMVSAQPESTAGTISRAKIKHKNLFIKLSPF